jgi:Fe-S oxidoreductase
MEPHGAWNYCCGGGGGLAATGEYGKIRMEMGKVKAEQIQKTGAKVVATNCYNCRTQISELNTKYKLGVKVKSIVELVADSLEVSGKEK